MVVAASNQAMIWPAVGWPSAARRFRMRCRPWPCSGPAHRGVQRHDPSEEIGERFGVSVSWIRDLLRRRRETGSIAPKPRGGGRPPAFDEAAAERLREAVRADSDATLAELAEVAGVSCCPSAVHRALRRLGITRKKSRGGRAGSSLSLGRTGRSREWSGRPREPGPVHLTARPIVRPVRSTHRGWSSSTRAGPRRRWTAPGRRPRSPAACGSTATQVLHGAPGWS